MNALRKLSWGGSPPPAHELDGVRRHRHRSDSDGDSHRHSHRRRREKKNYPANPFGGNRPVGSSAREGRESFPPLENGDSSASLSEDSDDSPPAVTRTSSVGSSASRSRRAPVTRPRPGPASAPPSSLPQKSESVLISRPRRATHGTAPTPGITRTPPTPSPLEQLHQKRSKTVPALTSQPLQFSKSMPPYPVTPPATMDSPTRKSYMAYHDQSDLPPALRAGSPQPPSPTSPSSTRSPQLSNPQRSPPRALPPLTTTTTTTASVAEDPYDYLRTFDTVFLIDDSLSMSTGNRWTLTSTALSTFASIATTYDTDGIDIHFLNSPLIGRNLRSSTAVSSLFAQVHPTGCTPTGAALERILRDYLARYRPHDAKPLNIVVITDGAATDDPESVIVWAARRLEALDAPLMQVGVQFVQIGDDAEAREALVELDDVIARVHGVRDMVDTVWWRDGEMGMGGGAEAVVKVLVGGVNRRWDRRR